MIIDPSAEINRNVAQAVVFGRLGRIRTFVVWLAIVVGCSEIGGVPELCFGQTTAKTDGKSSEQKESSPRSKPLVALGVIRDPKIVESSGMALASPLSVGGEVAAFWTFNDSGGEPELYRVSFSGQTEARLRLANASNRDWEAMCRFEVESMSLLAVGDVGDNSVNRKSYQIYVSGEPATKPPQTDGSDIVEVQKFKVDAAKIEFKYEDGAHNCEAMSFNAEDQSFWFVEKVYVNDKREKPPGIYVLADGLGSLKAKRASEKSLPQKIAAAEKNNTTLVAKRIADFPKFNITGMAFSADNQRLVIRSYFSAYVFEKAVGETWVETVQKTKPTLLAMPLQSQGEAICFSADGKSVLVTSEMQSATIWQVRVDQAALPDRRASE